MEVKFLKKMLVYPTLRNWSNKGTSLEAIEFLEKKYNNGNLFPQAFREYLYIAGKHSNLGDIDIGFGYEWMQEKAREELNDCGKNIDRPFFVVSQLDACTQFSFIYLDDNSEDPFKYNCFCHESYWDESSFIEVSPSGRFSFFINVCVDRAIIDDDFINGLTSKD
jgi:hypothetical protein